MEDPVAGSADLTLLVIEHPALAQILKIAFGAVWATGLTFDLCRHRAHTPAEASLIYPARTTAPLR